MNRKIKYRYVFNRRNVLRKDGTALIQMECTLERKKMYISTGLYVQVDQWNGINSVINHPLAKEYNTYLFNMLVELQTIEFNFRNDKNILPTLAMLKRAYINKIYPNAPFDKFVENIIKISATRSQRTKESYKTLVNSVTQFRPGLMLAEIDLDFINEYINWLKDRGLTQSTISARLKGIRAIINEAIARKVIKSDDDPFQHFKIPKIKSREDYLTKEEIKRLENLQLTNKREAHVKDVALFAIYTGLRFSDLNLVTSKNLVKRGKKTWLVIVPKKTSKSSGITVELPIETLFDGKIMALIAKYGSIEKLAHIGDNAAANRTLKQIVAKIHLANAATRKITFHTLRHTFVSYMLSIGVPLTTIQKMVGHTKMDMTLNYTHLTNKMIEKDTEKAFKKRSKSE